MMVKHLEHKYFPNLHHHSEKILFSNIIETLKQLNSDKVLCMWNNICLEIFPFSTKKELYHFNKYRKPFIIFMILLFLMLYRAERDFHEKI